MGPIRDLPEGARPEDWLDENEAEVDETPAQLLEADPTNDAGVPAPERVLQFKVQFTASQEYVDLLEEARALLGHEKPRPDLPDVQLRALRLLVVKLRKERRGELDGGKATAPARSTAPARVSEPSRDEAGDDVAAPARIPRPANDGKVQRRSVPRGDQRTVWARDAARCAYVDDRGVRCRETTGLELHHRRAHGLGGPDTSDNLELRCRAHNTLAAEADFGREHMERVRPSDPRIGG